MIAQEKLRTFSLLDSLSRDGLAKVAEQFQTRELNSGDTLFSQGERDAPIYFLLEGTIELRSELGTLTPLKAGSDAARLPISRLKPRRYSAIALSHARVAMIDEDVLDDLMTSDQSMSYEVSLIEGEDPEWMFQLFSNPLFAKVPATNMSALCHRMQAIPVQAGQVILNQGDTGDYYYLIRRGQARIKRSFRDEKPVLLAEIGPGQGFGEEALISGDPRNATVEMTEDGVLMRLSMHDFNELLKPALVQKVNPREALTMVKKGARFLDVRTEAEFRENAIPGSQNLPLCNLRRLARGLDSQRPYITVCQSGRRCSVAAFLLGQLGFEVYVLRDGLDELSLDPPK